MKTSKLILLSTVCSALSAPAIAQNLEIPNIPSASVIDKLTESGRETVTKYLQSKGVELTHLGEKGGLNGYLAVDPDGNMQVIYVTQDEQYFVAGLMTGYSSSGLTTITGGQIAEMQRRYEDAAVNSKNADLLLPPKISKAAGENVALSAAPWVSGKDPKIAMTILEQSGFFEVGDPSAPLIYMLADPQCPFCHATWEDLAPMVQKSELRVRVVMIAILAKSEDKAISILSRPNPAAAWMKGEGSRKGVPVLLPPKQGTPEYNRARRLLERNEEAGDKLQIQATPYLWYESDGVFYENRGRPKDLEAFLSEVKS